MLKYNKDFAGDMLQKAEELVIIGSQVRSTDNDLRNLIKNNLDDKAKVTLAIGPEKKDPDKKGSKAVKKDLNKFLENDDIDNTGMYFGEYADNFLLH